jgi:alpha-L-fucosidase 2
MMASPLGQLPYQPIGDILLTFPKVETAENYRRDLNLRTATASVQFTSEGTTFKREMFASYPDNVMVLRLTRTSSIVKEQMIPSSLTVQTFQIRVLMVL